MNHHMNVEIKKWKTRNKLPKRVAGLLLEAYRRFNQFAKGKTLEQAWTGLGTHSSYNNTYFKPVFSVKHSPSWFSLTPKGVIVVQDLINSLPWNEDYSLPIFVQDYEM